MKKILILSMSCRDDFFKHQTEIIKETWAKDIIDGKYPNIEFISYYGWNDKHTYVKDDHSLMLRCEDDLENTFKKTYYALSVLMNNGFDDYDYVFRTNTSTFVNVPLLNAFVQSLDNDDTLWCSELYSLSEGFTPYPLNLFGRGNGILMSKKLVNILLKEGISFLYLGKCDDWTIGNVLNSYWIKQGENYLDHIKSYKHGWYKCIPNHNDNNHTLCQFWNDSQDVNYLGEFITIQIKTYHNDRMQENKSYYELINLFNKKPLSKTKLKEKVKHNYEYSKDPNIFVGSILGYITYDKWTHIDKMKLYDLQVNNKASDDAEKYNLKNRVWY